MSGGGLWSPCFRTDLRQSKQSIVPSEEASQSRVCCVHGSFYPALHRAVHYLHNNSLAPVVAADVSAACVLRASLQRGSS